MSFTVADVITEVREQVQDTLQVGAEYRYSDLFLLRKIDMAVRHMLTVRPDLFTHIGDMTCVAGTLQSAPADSVRLMDVVRNRDGVPVKEVNQETLDLMIPAWTSTAAGPVTNWMRYQRSPNHFYVFPPASAGDALTISYARCTPLTSTAATVPLQDAYLSTVAFGAVWLVESIDAEHTESGRAAAFEKAFSSALASGLATRQITDTQNAGVPAQK
jgi:hypothetical protein